MSRELMETYFQTCNPLRTFGNDNLPVEYCYYSKGHLKLVFLFRSAFINYGPGQIWPFAVFRLYNNIKVLIVTQNCQNLK